MAADEKEHRRSSTQTVDSGKLGDVMGSRWAVPIHGDMVIPEFASDTSWKPLRTIGAKCSELGAPLEKDE